MKLRTALILAGACAAALTAASVASAQPGGGRRATLYEFPNFQGRSYTVYGRNDGLGPSGFEDDAMSGQFDGDWLICEDDNYQGHCERVTGNVRNMDRIGLGHEVSSLRSLGWRGAGGDPGGYGPGGYDSDNRDYGRGGGRGWGNNSSATFYEYPNFQGRSYTVTGRNDAMGDTGFEDRAMSAYFQGPWQICEDDNYQGHCETVTGDVRNLDRIGLGHQVSSARSIGR